MRIVCSLRGRSRGRTGAVAWLVVQTLAVAWPAGAAERPVVTLTDAARRLHGSALVIDGHNDLPWRLRELNATFDALDLHQPQPLMHTDVPRLRAGGLGGQFWSAYVPADTDQSGEALRMTLEQIDVIHELVRRYPEVFEMAATADDVERIHASGKIASLIGIEGGHSIQNSIGALRQLYRLGARYMTLTHSDTLSWADSATDEARHGGLTAFGEEVVREMNRLGMLVDISHVSPETMHDALRVSRAPVIASHSSAFAIAAHPRNVPDDVLKLVRDNGGVIMVNYYPGFVVPKSAETMTAMFQIRRELREKHGKDTPEYKTALKQWEDEHPIDNGTIHDVVDHIDHLAKVAGVDHIGIGSDYDGISRVPAQLEDVSTYPLLTQELLNRGYSEPDIRKILGLNIVRALRRAEDVAREMQAGK
jgi:membrane dipeptidase